MKFKMFLFILSIFFLGCQNTNNQPDVETNRGNDAVIIDTVIKDNKHNSGNSLESPDPSQAILALTSNALQVVNIPSGSTSEIAVGMEMNKVLEIVSRVLKLEIPVAQVNSECGAGPMTMMIFKNGLVLMFQKAKDNPGDMDFVGWSVSDNGAGNKLTTMANIGIGSTRAELESAYNVKITKTSLGMEFTTLPDGLYGIIDGPSETSKINFMWSGLSCNFR